MAHRADDIIGRLAAANEADRIAAGLERRGGGLTAHAAELLRERAARERDQLARDVKRLVDGDDT